MPAIQIAKQNMKTLHKFSILLAVAIAVSACGAQNVSTTATSVVTSTTVSTATIELPTETTIPPTVASTETSIPTETPTEIPSPEATAPATATLTSLTSGTGDPCNKRLQAISGGKLAKIKIQNNSGSPITVSIFLNKTAFGDCGYRGYALGKYDSILITDLIQACYNISVSIDNPKKQIKAYGYGCINNPDKWSFIITKDSVSLQGR